jgi:hypothetical protein
LLSQQADKEPLLWNGRVNDDGTFIFYEHGHLSHITNAWTTEYFVYRPREQKFEDCWEIWDPWLMMIEPSEFLIFRQVDVEDDRCPNLRRNINYLHSSMADPPPPRPEYASK